MNKFYTGGSWRPPGFYGRTIIDSEEEVRGKDEVSEVKKNEKTPRKN